MESLRKNFNDFFFTPDKGWTFSVARFLFFTLIWLYLFQYIHLNTAGWLKYSVSSGWHPVSLFRIFSEPPLFDAITLGYLDSALSISLICCALGLFSPINYFISFVLMFYLIGMPINFGKVHHSLHMASAVMMLLALCKYSGPLSLDQLLFGRWRPQPIESPEYRWPVRLIWFFMIITYFWAGLQKLRYGGIEWVFSDNMATILLTRSEFVPLGHWLAQFDIACYALAFYGIGIELIIPLAFKEKWRWLIWGCFMLHVGTRMTLGVDGGFEAWLLCYVFWIPWDKLIKRFA